jgi:hypothetical protein
MEGGQISRMGKERILPGRRAAGMTEFVRAVDVINFRRMQKRGATAIAQDLVLR